MCDVDTFLTRLSVLVDEVDKVQEPPLGRPLPCRPGPAPHLSRSEVVTLAIFAQWARFESERAFYRYAVRHLRAAFPRLPARSQFNRLLCQAAVWHQPRRIGLVLAPGGWVIVDALLAACAAHGMPITRAELNQIVARNNK